MTTRRLFALLVAMTLLGQACMSQEPDCASASVFCAGLVTTTEGLADHHFNQAVWDEMQIARSAGLLNHIAYIESVSSRDYAKNIDAFALDGYDLILTTGMTLRDETLQAAQLYPDVFFIGVDQAGEESRPNLFVVTFADDQAGFLAGALAARLTKAGYVGAVCETSGIDANWRTCEGFRNGVAYIDPSIRVDVEYRDNGSREKLFLDAGWGRETGGKIIRRGADVIFGMGGGTGQGALLAAAESGVYAIGAERDQFYALPEARPALITSVFKWSSLRVQQLIRTVRLGAAQGGIYQGQIRVAPYRNPTLVVPEDVQRGIQTLAQQLESGPLRTNVPVEFPK